MSRLISTAGALEIVLKGPTLQLKNGDGERLKPLILMLCADVNAPTKALAGKGL